MPGLTRSRWILVLLTVAALIPAPALAHPGTGIVVDRLGQVYFVDMVSGIWKLDLHGALTHLPGPAFHWMTLDAEGRFASGPLPSGSGGDFARIGSGPTLLLASDFPLALGQGGALYYPSVGRTPLQLLKTEPGGLASMVATLPEGTVRGPLRHLNGLAAAPDGSLYYSEDAAVRRIRAGRVSTVVEQVVVPGCGSHNPLLRGLAVGEDGTLYVAATGCAAVLKLRPSGQLTVLPQVPRPWAPTGVARSGTDLYVLEFEKPESDDRREMLPRVRRISADGTTRVLATVTRIRP